jgi:hypothetical protein
MTTQRAPFRTQWVHRDDEVKPEPISERQKRARRLPMPGPGIVVTVPLHLLPEYLQIYSLQPNGIREPKVQPKYGPGEAILLVKRVPSEGK